LASYAASVIQSDLTSPPSRCTDREPPSCSMHRGHLRYNYLTPAAETDRGRRLPFAVFCFFFSRLSLYIDSRITERSHNRQATALDGVCDRSNLPSVPSSSSSSSQISRAIRLGAASTNTRHGLTPPPPTPPVVAMPTSDVFRPFVDRRIVIHQPIGFSGEIVY